MAATKRKSRNVYAANRDAVHKLWKHVDAQRWYALLREVAPQQRWQLHGTSVKGLCPYHNDSDPSFVLDFNRGCGKCFGSCEKYVGDIIQLFAHLRGATYSETILWLDAKIGINDLIGGNSDELARLHYIQEMKKAAAMAFVEVSQEYIREKPKHLSYLEPGMVYLETGRNIPRGILPLLPVSLFPKPEHAKKYIREEFHAAFDEYFGKYQTQAMWGSPVFHYNDSPGSISRFKIRKLDPAADALLAGLIENDDLNVDSAKRLCTHDFLFVEDKYVQDVGIYGLHHYMRSIGKVETSVYITEGEFDALSVMAGQILADRHDIVMLASSGKGVPNVGFLRDLGIRTVYLVQDSPVKKGDSVACGFLSNSKNFDRDGAGKPLLFKIFCWPAGLIGGDLDEAVQLNGYEAISYYLYTERNKYFLNSYAWVKDKCLELVDRVRADTERAINLLDASDDSYDRQRKNLEADRDREVCGLVQQWLSYLHEPSDKLTFTETFAQVTGIDVAKIDSVRSSIYRLDTVDGARERIRESLDEYLSFMYYSSEPGSRSKTFFIWSKKRMEVLKFVPSDDARRELLSSILGMPTLDWVKSILGENSVLEDRCKAESGALAVERQRVSNLNFLMSLVYEDLMSACSSDEDLSTVAQGIHFHGLKYHNPARNNVYFVNGSYLFRGTFAQQDATVPIEWEQLTNPVDNGLKFALSKGARWSHVTDVADLYAATHVDLKTLYAKVRAILDAWEFEHDDVNKAWLASWIISVPCMAAIGDVNITYVTGESASGKTSLLRGLLGGARENTHIVPSILEASKFTADCTKAWMQQEMASSALLLVIDEAEAGDDTTHHTRVKELQTTMYNIPMGGTSIDRGGVTSESKVTYFLRMPIIMGGINMNADSVFLSRLFTIYTRKDPKKQNCGAYIMDRFSQEEIQELRKQLTVAMLPYIPKLQSYRHTLRVALAEATKDEPSSSRFIDTTLTVLSVYHLIDPEKHDPVKLFKQIVEVNKPRLEAISNQSWQSEIIDAAMYNASVKFMNADGVADYRTARSLIKEGEVNLLNSADCGVYCIPERKWIVIVWRMAKFSVLRMTSYARLSESAMKESVSHNKYVLQDLSQEDHQYIVRYLDMSDVKSSTEYSVIALEYLMTDEEQELLTGVAEEKESIRNKNRSRKAAGNSQSSLPPIEAYEFDADDEFGSESVGFDL